jgi:streptogramin lyase
MSVSSRTRHGLIAGLCTALALAAGAVPSGASTISTVSEVLALGPGATPRGLINGRDGTLWVAIDGTNMFQRITPSGEGAGQILLGQARPSGIAIGSDGNVWFTAPDPDSGTDYIGMITSLGEVTTFPVWGTGPGALVAGRDGDLWFTAETVDAIVRFDVDGFATGLFPLAPGADPQAIAAAADGNLWFTEPGVNSIGRVTPAGVVSEFSIPTAGAAPSAITAGSDGNVWFTEPGVNSIGRVTPAGVVSEFSIPTAGAAPSAITAGPDGNLWFTEPGVSSIGRITLAGEITEFPTGLGAGAGDSSIVTGPDGNLWFTEEAGRRVGKAVLAQTNETMVTATVEGVIQIRATPLVDFGQVAVGSTKLGSPNPASVVVASNDSGYTLSVTRTAFSRGDDVPLSLAVTNPEGATSNLDGQTAIPTSGSLSVGSRSDAPPQAGDEWSPVYRLGPVPLRPAGPTWAVVTYTAVAT